MATVVPTTFSNSLSGSVSFSANDTVVIQDASVDFTTGLTMSGSELSAFKVTPSCTSSFGSVASGAVTLDMDGTGDSGNNLGLLEYNGRGNISRWTPTTTIARTNVIDTGSGTFYGVGGTWTQLEQGGGKTQFDSTADVVAAYIEGGSCIIAEHASQAVDTLVTGPASNVIVSRDIGAATVGGVLSVPERSATATTLTLLPGSRVVWSGGAITNLVMYKGSVLDITGASQNITATNATFHDKSVIMHKPSGGFVYEATNETLIGNATSFN